MLWSFLLRSPVKRKAQTFCANIGAHKAISLQGVKNKL
jgi:hypothetical protein